MKTYFFKTQSPEVLNLNNRLVGRIKLPEGNYTIQAKAMLVSLQSRWNYSEIFNAELKCGSETDTVLMKIFPRLDKSFYYGEDISFRPPWIENFQDHGGQEACIFLQLAVKLDQESFVDFIILNAQGSHKNSTLQLNHASILARLEEELIISDSFDRDNETGNRGFFRNQKLEVSPELLEMMQTRKF